MVGIKPTLRVTKTWVESGPIHGDCYHRRMTKLLLNLRNVPDDEADDVRALLDDHDIAYYETSPGFSSISRQIKRFYPFPVGGCLIGFPFFVGGADGRCPS
jgi:hypothetical protein